MTLQERPKIGVGVYIVHQGKVLMMQRKSSHGEGTWCPPGGHLEHAEHWFECAAREAMEEVGIAILQPRLFAVTNDIFDSGKHYVTLHIEAKPASASFVNKEPEKHAHISWFSWDSLPKPLFGGIESLLQSGEFPSYLLDHDKVAA